MRPFPSPVDPHRLQVTAVFEQHEGHLPRVNEYLISQAIMEGFGRFLTDQEIWHSADHLELYSTLRKSRNLFQSLL